MKKTFLTAALTLTLIGGGITGASVYAAVDKQDNDDISQKQLKKEATITKEEAITIALKEVPGKAVKTEFDYEDGKTIYEIDVLSEDGKMWTFDIDAKNGELLQVEDESSDDDWLSDKEEQKQLKKEAKLSLEESQAIALKEVKGDVVDSELDYENGMVVYSFEIIDDQGIEHDVEVDAKNGTVLKVENENDDYDNDDNDND